MKNQDLIATLQGMPLDAEVEIDLGEEYHSFTVDQDVRGDPEGVQMIALALDPDPPHIVEILAKHARIEEAAPDMLAALKLAQRLVAEALPKFDWGKSALDANAIQLLNEVPIAINKALIKAEGSAS